MCALQMYFVIIIFSESDTYIFLHNLSKNLGPNNLVFLMLREI